jgi:predicted RNA polymerase sigma factor
VAGGPGLSAGELERVFRDEWGAVVATLARRLGDLQAAEDATQEAFAKAAAVWPRDGIPPKPGAWLTAGLSVLGAVTALGVRRTAPVVVRPVPAPVTVAARS